MKTSQPAGADTLSLGVQRAFAEDDVRELFRKVGNPELGAGDGRIAPIKRTLTGNCPACGRFAGPTRESFMGNLIQQTEPLKHVIIARVIAGLPMFVIGMMHFIAPANFEKILRTASIPLVEVNMVAAPAAEVLAGTFLLSGFFARVGGFLGLSTMIPAIYSTLVINSLRSSAGAAKLGENFPFVPPIPIPVIVLLACAYVMWRGGGAWSADYAIITDPHHD